MNEAKKMTQESLFKTNIAEQVPVISQIANTEEQKSTDAETVRNAVKEMRSALQNFNKILARRPPAKLVRQYLTYNYMPIEYYEEMLRKIYFGQFQIIERRCDIVFNEISVTYDVMVLHPVTNIWLTYSGTAGVQIMQDAQTRIADFAMHKKGNALQTCQPKAKAEAVKNACKQIGRIFGGSLNRKLEDDFDVTLSSALPISLNQ